MSSPANSVNAGDEKSEGAGTPNQTTAAASAKPKQAFTSSLPIMTSTRRNYTIIAKPEGQSQPQQPVQQKMASTAAIELTGPGLQVGSRGSSPVVGRGTQSEQVLQKQEGGWGGPEGSPAMNNLMGRSAPGETGGMMRGPGDVYEEDFIDEPGSQFVGNGMPMNMRNGMNGMGPMNNGMVMQQGNGVMFRSNDMYGQPLPFGNDYYGNSGMMRQGGPPPMMMNRNMPGMYMGPQPGMNGEMMMGIGGPDGFRGVPYQQQRGPMMMYPRGPPQMQQPMQPMGHMPFHMQQQQMMMNR
ncbi:hypothetical protein BJ742DRAFT_379703 [Cladochytrium replicatum]|nr:hypothetical protein BJ742DRAFT_379703 [Cladochytrium replicatum]